MKKMNTNSVCVVVNAVVHENQCFCLVDMLSGSAIEMRRWNLHAIFLWLSDDCDTIRCSIWHLLHDIVLKLVCKVKNILLDRQTDNANVINRKLGRAGQFKNSLNVDEAFVNHK